MDYRYKTFGVTGTTTPIFVPHSETETPSVVHVGQDYFYVQIHGAQAAFTGKVWERVKNLVVSTQISVKHPKLGLENMRAIQRTRDVHRDQAEQLGMCPNLIGLVPSIMTDVTISIDYILDKENVLRTMSGLINSDSFLATLSLAPGAAMVAKTISGVAGKIIETFIPAEEREPILQFSGDFNLSDNNLKEGYYVILGSNDSMNPLPSKSPNLKIRNGQLYMDGSLVTQLSYVILDIHAVQVRTRECNEGALWADKLCEAEDESRRLLTTDDERLTAEKRCMSLITEAQTLIRSDINYLRSEAEAIITQSMVNCISNIYAKPIKTSSDFINLIPRKLTTATDTAAVHGKALRELPSKPRIKDMVAVSSVEELEPVMEMGGSILDAVVDDKFFSNLSKYNKQVTSTQKILKHSGLL